MISQNHVFQSEIKERSDKLMNYFLAFHFLVGLALAGFYGTWLIAICLGGILLIAYYSAKIALPNSTLYQYVLSAVLGIFMALFIYQMHGMFEMYFFAFIGSALLVTYQQWKLQIPLTLVVAVHYRLLGYLQDVGLQQFYFKQLNYFDLQTLIIHVTLAAIGFFICGLCAFQLRKYSERQNVQTIKTGELEKETELSVERAKIGEALEDRNTILESITDAFFAVDRDWMVLYWNAMAEKELGVPRNKILNQHLWKVFADSMDSESYRQYQLAMKTRQVVHFQDFYPVLEKWYDISVYPAVNGLSVYFKDVTDRKLSEIRLMESEKRYSELFQLSPLPMWVFEIETLRFLDVNEAAVRHYGYSRPEFLGMTIKNIRPQDEVPVLEQIVNRKKTEKQVHHEHVFRHRIKDGRIIYADIQSTAVIYNDKPARVVLAVDVTERLNYVSAVEAQNKKLKEIAWLQSHVIRAPLAKIKGLIPLMKDGKETITEKEKMLDYLLRSADELDEVINSITDKSDEVEVQGML